MCKHAETLHTNKGCNLAIVFIPISPFSNIVINTVINAFLLVQFDVDWVKRRRRGTSRPRKIQRLFARKLDLANPYFLYENESLQHCFSYYLRRVATFLVFVVRFFQGVRFFLRPRTGFRLCPKRLAVLETSKRECTH